MAGDYAPSFYVASFEQHPSPVRHATSAPLLTAVSHSAFGICNMNSESAGYVPPSVGYAPPPQNLYLNQYPAPVPAGQYAVPIRQAQAQPLQIAAPVYYEDIPAGGLLVYHQQQPRLYAPLAEANIYQQGTIYNVPQQQQGQGLYYRAQASNPFVYPPLQQPPAQIYNAAQHQHLQQINGYHQQQPQQYNSAPEASARAQQTPPVVYPVPPQNQASPASGPGHRQLQQPAHKSPRPGAEASRSGRAISPQPRASTQGSKAAPAISAYCDMQTNETYAFDAPPLAYRIQRDNAPPTAYGSGSKESNKSDRSAKSNKSLKSKKGKKGPSHGNSNLALSPCPFTLSPPVPKPSPPPPRAMFNKWMDFRAGDPWPALQLVKALDKTLDTIPGQNPDQYVALWYQQGEPVMGRIWNEGGKIAANFAWFNREYTGNVGSIQLLVHISEHVRGFDYQWKPFSEVFVFGTEREYVPVHVNHHKGDISPAVITFNGKQILGKCDVRNEKASAGFGGKENIVNGPPVHSVTMVLTRKARAGYKFN